MKICEKESMRSNSNRLSEESRTRAISPRMMNSLIVCCVLRSTHCAGKITQITAVPPNRGT